MSKRRGSFFKQSLLICWAALLLDGFALSCLAPASTSPLPSIGKFLRSVGRRPSLPPGERISPLPQTRWSAFSRRINQCLDARAVSSRPLPIRYVVQDYAFDRLTAGASIAVLNFGFSDHPLKSPFEFDTVQYDFLSSSLAAIMTPWALSDPRAPQALELPSSSTRSHWIRARWFKLAFIQSGEVIAASTLYSILQTQSPHSIPKEPVQYAKYDLAWNLATTSAHLSFFDFLNGLDCVERKKTAFVLQLSESFVENVAYYGIRKLWAPELGRD